MAKVTLSTGIERIQGKLGNAVFRVSRTGQQQITKLPDMSRVKWSQAQKEHRQRFKQAVAYARAAMAQPDVRALYEKMAAEKNRRPFDMAVSDYFKGNDRLSNR